MQAGAFEAGLKRITRALDAMAVASDEVHDAAKDCRRAGKRFVRAALTFGRRARDLYVARRTVVRALARERVAQLHTR